MCEEESTVDETEEHGVVDGKVPRDAGEKRGTMNGGRQ
jgi:hypothetical protein